MPPPIIEDRSTFPGPTITSLARQRAPHPSPADGLGGRARSPTSPTRIEVVGFECFEPNLVVPFKGHPATLTNVIDPAFGDTLGRILCRDG
jgi:hypothetical protein